MNQSEDLSHPAVELPLPLDGETREIEIPRETTLFFWTTLAVGTRERIPPIRSSLGSSLFDAGVDAQERMSWSVSIDGESVPLLTDSYYREGEYTGLAWWTAREPIDAPASVRIRFKTDGEQPTAGENRVTLWSPRGEPIPWGSTVESNVKLAPSDSSPSEFPTRKEQLWKQHTVFTPQ